MAMVLGAEITTDGRRCRIRGADQSGRRKTLVFPVDDIVRLILSLADCARRSQMAQGRNEIPYFPVQALKVLHQTVDDQCLISFVVDPGMEVRFGVDRPSLQRGIAELGAFLEAGPEGATPTRTH